MNDIISTQKNKLVSFSIYNTMINIHLFLHLIILQSFIFI